MPSNENEDSTPPITSEEPIVAKLAKSASANAGGGGEPAAHAANESEGDDLGATAVPTAGDSSQRESSPDTNVRTGSPFAVDPNPIAGTLIRRRRAKVEAFYDVGPLKYTAMGAVSAAVVVLGFAGAAAWWFPGGGTIVAALGCALSIFGLYSNKKVAASGCLVLHLLLFMISYSRAITV